MMVFAYFRLFLRYFLFTNLRRHQGIPAFGREFEGPPIKMFLTPSLRLRIKLSQTRVGYSRGARLSQRFCSNSGCFGANLTLRYFRISCKMKEFFPSHTTCRKYFLVTGRNFLAPHVIDCHMKKFLVTDRNL